MVDSNFNAATQTKTAKKDRFQVYNFKNKGMAVKTYIQQWQARMKSAFKWNNLPETIVGRDLEELLQDEAGYATMADHSGEKYAVYSTLGGNDDNANFKPGEGMITNTPLNWEETVYFKNNLKHEQNAVLIRNTSNMCTLEELVYGRYARLMTETDITMMLALIQTRAMLIAVCEDDEQKKAVDNYIKDLGSGNLTSILNDKVVNGIQLSQGSTTLHQALTDINEAYQYFKASLYQDLGISAQNNMKREAVMSGEADLITTGLTTLIDDMLKCRQDACEEMNKLWGLNVSVELDGVWKRAIQGDGIEMEEDNDGGIENEENLGETGAEENATEAESGGTEGEGGTSTGSEDAGSEEGNSGDGSSGEQETVEEKDDEEIKVEVNVNIDDADTVSIEEAVEEERKEEEQDDVESREDEEN